MVRGTRGDTIAPTQSNSSGASLSLSLARESEANDTRVRPLWTVSHGEEAEEFTWSARI